MARFHPILILLLALALCTARTSAAPRPVAAPPVRFEQAAFRAESDGLGVVRNVIDNTVDEISDTTGLSTGAIIGIAVAAAVVFILFLVFCCCCCGCGICCL